MSPAIRTENFICGGCNRETVKAAILFEGQGYCKTCWKKLFSPVPCQDCGKPTSSYQGQTPVKCKTCRAKNRSCTGCGKVIPTNHVGKVFADGSALCDNCVRQTKPESTCPGCGNVTKHLARDRKSGFDEPVCSACRHKGKKEIVCAICNKRKYPRGTIDGKSVCHTCFEKHQPTMCPTCGKVSIPLSRTQCRDCELQEAVRKDTQKHAESLQQAWCRNLLMAFLEEHLKAYGGYDTGLRFENYMPFFRMLDITFKSVDDLTVEDVLRNLPDGNFNKYMIPYSFLLKRKLIVEIHDDRRDGLNLSSQARMLEQVRSKWYGTLMQEYQDELVKVHERYKERGWVGRKRRFTLKSITGMLKTAMTFCELTTDIKTSTQFDNHHIEEFLAKKPGCRDMLSPFIRFLRLKRKTFARIKMPKKVRSYLNLDSIMDGDRCDALLRQWLHPTDGKVKESLICLLMLLYAQRVPKIVMMQLDHIFEEKTGVYTIVVGKKKTLRLHEAVSDLLRKYLSQRKTSALDDDQNPFLFPGFFKGSHISETSVRAYLQLYGVTGRELYSTALYRAVSMGVRIPSSLVSAFGVSVKTATAYTGILNEQMYKDTENCKR